MTTFDVENGYITLPVTVDPNALAAQALDTLVANIPGFVPREGHLETMLVEILASMVAEAAIVASQAPLAIFQSFGESLLQLPIEPGAAAQALTTWTFQDTAGYTVPAGTVVGFQISGSQLLLFTLPTTLVVTPGNSTATGVIVQAEAVGAAANGLSAQTLVLIDPLAYVTSVISTTPTSGGVDPETPTAYLNRLSNELQLLAPRPILPGDYAAISVNVIGVARALGIDGYNPQRTFTDGTTYNGSPWIVSPSQAQFDIPDNGRTVTGAGIPGGTTKVATTTPSWGNVWAAAHAYALGDVIIPSVINGNIFQCTTAGTSAGSEPVWPIVVGATVNDGTAVWTCRGAATAALLSANATATATGVSITLGVLTNQMRTIAVAAIDSAGAILNNTIKANLLAYLKARREITFIIHLYDPTYTTVNVTYGVSMKAGQSSGAIVAAINAALTRFLSPANWAGGDQSPPIWLNQQTVYYLKVAQVIENVPGVDHIVPGSLLINSGTADVVLGSPAGLPQPGTMSGSAS